MEAINCKSMHNGWYCEQCGKLTEHVKTAEGLACSKCGSYRLRADVKAKKREYRLRADVKAKQREYFQKYRLKKTQRPR